MRAEAVPDLPAVSEFVSGYEVSAWYGMGAPTGTPPEVIDKINKDNTEAFQQSRRERKKVEMRLHI